MEVETVKSTKGKKLLYRVNGFLFETEKSKSDTIYCRCVRKRWENCPARAIICKEPRIAVRKLQGEHNHTPDEKRTIKLTATAEFKEAVLARADRGVKAVYDEVLVSAIADLRRSGHFSDQAIGVAVPNFQTIRPTLHRQRAILRPTLPRSMADIALGDAWAKTVDGRDFLVIDDGVDRRILGFTTIEMVTGLCNAPIVYMDGTFSVVPKQFQQLYTLHAMFKEQILPLAFFLLPEKSAETYRRMLTLLRAKAASWGMFFNPCGFQIDFEVAAIRAIEHVFPAAQIKGCFFHFSQCLWRKWQQLGLAQDAYAKNDEAKRVFRLVKTLALTPLQCIDDAWIEISSESPEPASPVYASLERFKEYVIATWLENGHIYPRVVWNHYGNDGPRTTNNLEGWHHALNTVIRKKHVDIYEP